MIFAHVDVNSFYASCETVFRPDLKGFPIIVLSNNDGCVIARSSEAKTLGIKMGQPYFELSEKFLTQYNVKLFSSNYALYDEMSNRVMDTIGSLVPELEVYSIDEAFCDVSNLDNIINLDELGHNIRSTVKQHTHLTVGVGIAQTKTLAKLANYAAKKWHKTGGVVNLTNQTRQIKLMKITPVSEVWGIGKALSKSLDNLGIRTAFDLAKLSPNDARKQFNVVLERTIRELNGESCLHLESVREPRQQIVCSRSFGKKVTTYDEMREAVSNYTVRAAEKLREEKQYCKHLTVFIKTSPFSKSQVYYNNLVSEKLKATNDTRELLASANLLLKKIWVEGKTYQKAGVILNDFCDTETSQYDMFSDSASSVRSEKLMHTLDKINQSCRGKLFFASQGVNGQWKMKQGHLSPCYTTRLEDIPVAKLK